MIAKLSNKTEEELDFIINEAKMLTRIIGCG